MIELGPSIVDSASRFKVFIAKDFSLFSQISEMFESTLRAKCVFLGAYWSNWADLDLIQLHVAAFFQQAVGDGFSNFFSEICFLNPKSSSFHWTNKDSNCSADFHYLFFIEVQEKLRYCREAEFSRFTVYGEISWRRVWIWKIFFV